MLATRHRSDARNPPTGGPIPGATVNVSDDQLRELVEEFFRAVSFDPGDRPSYPRIRELFVPYGRLTRNGPDGAQTHTVDEFIASRQAMVDSGRLTSFHEFEMAAVTESFGGVAHRLSTYGKRGITDGVPHEARGIISTQFLRTSAGWLMTSMAWEDERADLPLPDRYL